MASSLYHPDTVERSLKHDGSGDEPGLKDPDGNWDLRPHRERIIDVTDDDPAVHGMRSWKTTPFRSANSDGLYGEHSRRRSTRSPWLANPGSVHLAWSSRLAGTRRVIAGRATSSPQWGIPESWDDVILQGPHLYVATPMYKSPNPTMKHNQDWSATDFETLATDAIPGNGLQADRKPRSIRCWLHPWPTGPARAQYRIAWRGMAANTGRTNTDPRNDSARRGPSARRFSAGLPQGRSESLCVVSGFLSSLIADFAVRAAPKSDIRLSTINRLPVLLDHPLQAALVFAPCASTVSRMPTPIYGMTSTGIFTADQWAGGRTRANRPALGAVTREWTAEHARCGSPKTGAKLSSRSMPSSR